MKQIHQISIHYLTYLLLNKWKLETNNPPWTHHKVESAHTFIHVIVGAHPSERMEVILA